MDGEIDALERKLLPMAHAVFVLRRFVETEEKKNIITNYNMLPGDKDARNPSGLRIGVQEMTRFGMKEAEMGELASLMRAGLEGKTVKDEITKLRSRFTEVQYC